MEDKHVLQRSENMEEKHVYHDRTVSGISTIKNSCKMQISTAYVQIKGLVRDTAIELPTS